MIKMIRRLINRLRGGKTMANENEPLYGDVSKSNLSIRCKCGGDIITTTRCNISYRVCFKCGKEV